MLLHRLRHAIAVTGTQLDGSELRHQDVRRPQLRRAARPGRRWRRRSTRVDPSGRDVLLDARPAAACCTRPKAGEQIVATDGDIAIVRSADKKTLTRGQAQLGGATLWTRAGDRVDDGRASPAVRCCSTDPATEHLAAVAPSDAYAMIRSEERRDRPGCRRTRADHQHRPLVRPDVDVDRPDSQPGRPADRTATDPRRRCRMTTAAGSRMVAANVQTWPSSRTSRCCRSAPTGPSIG